MARVLVVEPFYGGSHRTFLDGLVRHAHHEFELLTLPGGEWRRRMRRSAQELAPRARQVPGDFDLLLVTDMLDLPAFLALTRPRFARTPVLCYFHENQFTYPRLRGTKFNSWFGQLNYLSACAADAVAFNSAFHREDFFHALRTLAATPNGWLVPGLIDEAEARSSVLPVGVELAWLDEHRMHPRHELPPLILWNHRWEFDKAPGMFARAIRQLAAEGLDFRLALAGDPGPNPDPDLAGLATEMGERVEHTGFVESPAAFARLLWESNVVVSTTRHEFFGVGMVEALYCECRPVAPRRYNYPDLVPPAWHESSLFDDEPGLLRLLRQAITAPRTADGAGRASASRFDWATVAPVWDSAIESMARRHTRRAGSARTAQICDAENGICS
jgi:glycosyltransferase involved in cell wall biosynthesis